MRRAIIIFSILALFLLVFLTEAAISTSAESSGYAQGETVKLICTKNRNNYKIVCKYRVYGKRSLTLVVQDRKRLNRRVKRMILKPQSGSFTWTGKRSRYGELVKAGATIVNFKNREVVASAEDYF